MERADSNRASRRITALGDDRRGQLVLLGGVVVALALVAMLVAFLQLGYHDDVATSASDDGTLTDARSFLERATHDVGRDVRGEYAWSERESAITAVTDQLRAHRRTLERTRAESGVVANATANRTVADRWANTRCPGGDGREFGDCVSRDGVVVQERDDRTLVLAVAYDLTVEMEGERMALTVVATAG